MTSINYQPLLNSSTNLKILLQNQNADGTISSLFSGSEPEDVLAAKAIFNQQPGSDGEVTSITGTANQITASASTGAITLSVPSDFRTSSLKSPAGNNLTLGTTDSGAAITVLSASNYVGIGTTGPTEKLSIYDGDINVTRINNTTSKGIYLKTGSTYDWGFRSLAGTSDLTIRAEGAAGEVMTLAKTTGNVGIGTTAPRSKLEASADAETYLSVARTTASSDGLVIGGITAFTGTADAWKAARIKFVERSGASIPITDIVFETQPVDDTGTLVEKMRIKSGGDVSITSTTAGSSGAGALVVTGGLSAGDASYFGGSVSFPSDKGIISSVNDGRLFLDGSANQNGGGIILYGSAHGSFPAQISYNGNTHVFKTVSGTQQLSLSLTAAAFAGAVSVTGDLFIGASSSVSAGALGVQWSKDTNGGYGYIRANLTSAYGHLTFFNPNGQVGQISTNGFVTTYAVSSDYRLKEITGPLTNSGAFIDALKPKVGTWKVDGSKFVGFIAHEFAEVSPSSVVGEKDALDADGNPKYQSMQAGTAEVIANLVAEIQSLRKRLAALEAK